MPVSTGDMEGKLLTFREIVEKYKKGGNLFEITIEKWQRIQDCFTSLDDISKLGSVIESARMGGAFCLEYHDNCHVCPIQQWCRDPRGTYQNSIRLMYLYAASRRRTYKEQVLKNIAQFLREMKACKEDFQRRLH